MAPIVTIFETDRINLLPKVREKVSAIENHQTQRTVQEFYDEIKGTFEDIHTRYKKGFLFDRYYYLAFREDESDIIREKLGLVFAVGRIYSAHYVLTDRLGTDVKKCVSAFIGPSSEIGRIYKNTHSIIMRHGKQVPLAVTIDGKHHVIKYN